jgi:hypothetical protein
LKEAETYFGAPGGGAGGVGSRVFNVVINGVTVDSNVDVFARAGGANIALDLKYTVNVTGGSGLDIQLQPVVSYPMLDGVQVISNTVNSPVFWMENTDNWSGLPCTSGCTIAIPALPGHVLYYRPVYLSGSTIVSRGLTQVQAVE